MKTALALALALLPGLTSTLLAQAPPPPTTTTTPGPALPTGPLLNRAPEFAQWTMVTRSVVADPTATASPGASPAASATPGRKPTVLAVDQQLVVTKTRTVRHEQFTGAGGSQVEKWCVPDMQLTVHGTGNPVVALPGGGEASAFTDYSKTDFGGFEWISARNFDGIEKTMGQDCLVFRDTMKLTADNARSGPPPQNVAWINADSRLPVGLQLGEEMRTYRFDPAPTDVLVLPPKVDTLIKQWRKTLRQASLPPAKP